MSLVRFACPKRPLKTIWVIIVSVIGSSQLTRTNIELCEIEGCQLPGILSHINVFFLTGGNHRSHNGCGHF